MAQAALTLIAGQLLGPAVQTCRDLAADHLIASVGRDLIRAANRWQGVARFEDPDFADDLDRARKQTSRLGTDLVTNGTSALAALLAIVSLAAVCAGLHSLMPILVILAILPSLSSQLDDLLPDSRSAPT
jgi:ATP-binding cassette subfamily B protein